MGTKPRTSHHRPPGERAVQRKSARRSSLRGWERAIVINQTNIGTVSKAKLPGGRVSERRGGAHGLFRANDYHLEMI